MKLRHFLFAALAVVTLAIGGCGQSGDTQSGSHVDFAADATVRTTSGETIYASYDSTGVQNSAISLQVWIRNADNSPVPGTVHFGDNTAARVFNGTELTHIYYEAGVFQLAAVPDGGAAAVIGSVSISEEPAPAPVAAPAPAPPPAPPPPPRRPLVSDSRLKHQIHDLGLSKQGFNLYQFEYLGDSSGQAYVGVMAQDLIDTHPHALVVLESGHYGVRYDLLGLRMVTAEQWKELGRESVEVRL